MGRAIYLDNLATTPVDPRVLEAMLPYLGERFGNPSSSHAFGWEAKEAVEAARRQVADLIGASPQESVLRTKAAADPDRDATHRRIHKTRRLRQYTDAEGAWNLTARGTPELGARFNLAIALYRCVHPDLGIPIGRLVSRTSRHHTRERPFLIGRKVAHSMEKVFSDGADAIVMGHVHRPEHLHLQAGEVVILGGWDGRLSYGVLEGGQLSLRNRP